ncbi:MAG TPA: DMT family transporter [Prolixibacteraceae bacterium]|nr:DMT family transporter [Prolixibacteraceae bacterium]
MQVKKWWVYLSLILAMIFWAFSFVWVKEVYLVYGPLTTVLFRLIIASVLLMVFAFLTGKLVKIDRKDLTTFVLLSLFEPFLYFLGESYGLMYVSSTVGAIIVATIPLFSPLAASRFHGEKISVRTFIGILLSFFGVSIVVFDSSFNLTASPLGIALEFLAVASAIGYIVVLKKLAVKYNPTSIITYQNLLGIIYFLPLWLIFEYRDFTSIPFDFPAFAGILKLSVFASCIAFIFYAHSVKRLGINSVNIFINIIPVFTAIFAWYILDEPLTLRKFIGIVVVISGLLLAQVKLRKSAERIIVIQQDAGR